MITDHHDTSAIFTSAQFPGAHRRLGVRVSTPFIHQGLPGKPEVCEVEIEKPTCNTQTTAKLAVPVLEWRSECKRQTLAVVASIDGLIADLETHRARLLDAAALIDQAPDMLPVQSPAASA